MWQGIRRARGRGQYLPRLYRERERKMKIMVTLEVETNDYIDHPRDWDWVQLVGEGTQYVSSKKIEGESK
jgi:hypothetical protein